MNTTHNKKNKLILIMKTKIYKTDKIILRKKKLLDNLSENKLEYIKNGVCDSYIKFGVPELEIVVENINTSTNMKINRLVELIEKLKEQGKKYNENVSYYQKYIRNGGDINYMIREGLKEEYYLNDEIYNFYLNAYKDENIAEKYANKNTELKIKLF